MAATLEKTSTPGIYKRGNRYVVVTRHRGKQHKSFHRTLAEAREAKANRTGSARSAPQSKRPFDEYAREWVASCQGRTSRGFDEDTRRAYATALEAHAIPHIGSTPLREIERRDVTALIRKLQVRGLSPATIAKYLAPLRAMFGDAVENEDLVANPALGLKINAKSRDTERSSERVKEMTRGELAAVLAAIPEQHRLVFEIMAHTGCRISEALGLDWTDVTFGDDPSLRIKRQWYRGKLKTPKTDAGSRTIELPAGLAAKLWELGADATGPVVHTMTGRRQSARNLSRTLEAARTRAGVPGATHHSFRHTHGSMLLDEGWTIAEVAERLGHADPAITARVYVHKMRDRRRELGFLDDLSAPVGNAWATQHPETAANPNQAVSAEAA
jgi:integrase